MELDDVGTRYKLYTELLDLWELGISILEDRFEFLGERDKEKLTILKHARDLLQKQVDIMSNVEISLYPLRRVIEEIHRETKIETEETDGQSSSTSQS